MECTKLPQSIVHEIQVQIYNFSAKKQQYDQLFIIANYLEGVKPHP